MSAACVPVLVRSPFWMKSTRSTFYKGLPFPRSVDWSATTLRLLPEHAEECAADDATWMSAWHASASMGELRRRVLAAYRAHLDYLNNPRGVASALLREAAARAGAGRRAAGNRSAAGKPPMARRRV